MKKATIQISYPAEKLEAIRHYTAEKGANFTAELEEALQKLYEKYVPKDVRGFLEAREQAAANQPSRPPRPVRIPASQTGHSQDQS